MKRQKQKVYALLLSMVVCLLMLIGCGVTQEEGKIPITTKSREAKEYFLQGRDLFEKLRGQDARPFFEKAIAEDENFAMACLFRSFVMPSVKEFWQNLNNAKELVEGSGRSITSRLSRSIKGLPRSIPTSRSHTIRWVTPTGS